MKRSDVKLLWLVSVTILPVTSSCSDIAGDDIPENPGVSWLESHAVPIDNVEPDVDEPNLSVLQETIGDARIVGMGEATHGTREFWKIRQKLSRYLVEEMGFTAILHEAPFPNSLYLHDYVTEGIGSASEAHQRLGYWRFQEMQELIAWMREYNVGRSEQDPPLHYYGYDCAFRNWTEAINLIAAYLEVVDPDAVDEMTTRLNNYTPEDAAWAYEFLVANAEPYIAGSSQEQYELILKFAENLEPSWQVWHNLENGLPELDIREECNVDNVDWIIDNLLDDGKVIIWAHNVHVGNTYIENMGAHEQMLGSRLKERYGEGYYIIGTEFYGGNFMAWEYCGGVYTAFIVHQAARPGWRTYAFRLDQAGIPIFYLDLSRADYSLEEAAWVTGPLDIRLIGAEYCAANDADYYYETSLPVIYDGIVHFENTNPTTRITF